MRKISAGLFITLDGVVEAPGDGDTSLEGKRGWSMPYMNDQAGMVIMNQMDSNDAMLLGRKTYQEFAAFWPSVPDEDPFGKRMNGMTKYVVTTTLDKADWKNSKLVKGNIAEEITKLKQQPGKNIGVTGSGTLVQWLLQHNLLDQLDLMLCPVVLGTGKRLFKDGVDTKVLKLVDSKDFGSGMIMLSYQPNR